MYNEKIQKIREAMLEIQGDLPPIDYDELLSGEYRMQQLAEMGGKRQNIPLITDMFLDKRENEPKQ